MPLSSPSEREHLHSRALDFQGYRRADGLFDIEAHLTDVKSYSFPNEFRGQIEAGEAIHDMWLRVTLDEDLIVRGIETVTDAGPYQVCPAVAPNFQRMVGVRIGAGWRRAVRDKVGGVEGCTHLAETLVAMGTVAFQTLYPYLAKKRTRQPGQRPPLLNSCHAFRAGGEVARRLWPDYSDRPEGEVGSGDGG